MGIWFPLYILTKKKLKKAVVKPTFERYADGVSLASGAAYTPADPGFYHIAGSSLSDYVSAEAYRLALQYYSDASASWITHIVREYQGDYDTMGPYPSDGSNMRFVNNDTVAHTVLLMRLGLGTIEEYLDDSLPASTDYVPADPGLFHITADIRVMSMSTGALIQGMWYYSSSGAAWYQGGTGYSGFSVHLPFSDGANYKFRNDDTVAHYVVALRWYL